MRAILFATILSLTPATIPAAQAAELVASKPDSSCATSSDPYESAARTTDSAIVYPGICVDTAKVRPARNVKIEGDKLSFQNYYFEQQFWKAELDLRNLDLAIYHVKPFPTIKGVDAAHAQLRFRMKPGTSIQLTNQQTGAVAQGNDLIVSFETADLRGQASVNFAVTLVPNYPLVGRVGATDTFLAEKNRPLEQYELDLSAEEISTLLTSALRRSEAIDLRTFYLMLRPNCASEAFDLIDALPRLNKDRGRFLSVVSIDPVAGPSVRGLQERGVLRRRIQDYSEEKQGITKVMAVADRPSQLPPFIPNVRGLPWTAVLVGPEPSSLSESERKAMAAIKVNLLTRIFTMAQSYAATAILAGEMDAETRTRLLLSSLKNSEEEIRAELREAEKTAPAAGRTLGVYFVPMQSETPTTSLESLGLPAALPFAVQERSTRGEGGTQGDIFYHVGANALTAADQAVHERASPAFFMGAAVVANILPGASKVSTQFLLGLNPGSHPVKSYNDQARIENLVIPESVASSSRLNRAVLIVSHRQAANAPLEPKVQIEFGPFGGLKGTLPRDLFGTFQVLNPTADGFHALCEMRSHAVPRFEGTFGNSPTGNSTLNGILRGRPLAFPILNATFDLSRLAVAELDVAVSSWPVDCAHKGDVDAQFMEQANLALDGLKKKAAGMNGAELSRAIQDLLGPSAR